MPASRQKWPVYADDEIQAALNVLKSGNVNYWTGSECKEFEREFASFHGVEHGVAVANGTLALELALRALGVGPGDEVIVTPRSFFASASAVVQAGARPVFADVDRDSQNISVDTIGSKITSRTKTILPVHLAGWPCDMPGIMTLAKKHGLLVLEDCAQAHGARIDGQLVGSFGDIAAFSFCQDKIISTAGEGGMLITNDRKAWKRAWEFKDHGKSFDRVHSDDHPTGFRWLHSSIGSNYRMTEIQAAIGRIQLNKLKTWVSQRQQNAARLIEGLSDLRALRIPLPSKRETHSYYKFYAFVRPERLKADWTRDRVVQTLAAQGVPGWTGSCPEIYREQAFEGAGHARLPIAHELGETSIMLPVDPTFTDHDMDRFSDALCEVMSQATR